MKKHLFNYSVNYSENISFPARTHDSHSNRRIQPNFIIDSGVKQRPHVVGSQLKATIPVRKLAKSVAHPMTFIKSKLLEAKNFVNLGSRSDLSKQPKVPPRRRPLSPRPKERTQFLGSLGIPRSFSPSNIIKRTFQTPKIVINSQSRWSTSPRKGSLPQFRQDNTRKSPSPRPRIIINQNPGDTGW